MPVKKKLIIAIDGPAGSGKSSTAKALAVKLKLPYIDTGAMYRAVTLKAMQKGVSLEDVKTLVQIAKKIKIRFVGAPLVGARKRAGTSPAPTGQRVFLDGKDVTKAIRTPELTRNVFYIAREPKIRVEMVRKQRILGAKSGAVMEGRDIGSVVFPKADYKFYFDADPKLRARRRLKELLAEGKKATFNQVYREILTRDATDTKRKTGALKVAKGALVLDTTPLTIPQTVDKILAILGEARGA